MSKLLWTLVLYFVIMGTLYRSWRNYTVSSEIPGCHINPNEVVAKNHTRKRLSRFKVSE